MRINRLSAICRSSVLLEILIEVVVKKGKQFSACNFSEKIFLDISVMKRKIVWIIFILPLHLRVLAISDFFLKETNVIKERTFGNKILVLELGCYCICLKNKNTKIAFAYKNKFITKSNKLSSINSRFQ